MSDTSPMFKKGDVIKVIGTTFTDKILFDKVGTVDRYITTRYWDRMMKVRFPFENEGADDGLYLVMEIDAELFKGKIIKTIDSNPLMKWLGGEDVL